MPDDLISPQNPSTDTSVKKVTPAEVGDITMPTAVETPPPVVLAQPVEAVNLAKTEAVVPEPAPVVVAVPVKKPRSFRKKLMWRLAAVGLLIPATVYGLNPGYRAFSVSRDAAQVRFNRENGWCKLGNFGTSLFDGTRYAASNARQEANEINPQRQATSIAGIAVQKVGGAISIGENALVGFVASAAGTIDGSFIEKIPTNADGSPNKAARRPSCGGALASNSADNG